MQNKKEYEQPEFKSLGSYLELTQVDNTSPALDGPCTCGGAGQLS